MDAQELAHELAKAPNAGAGNIYHLAANMLRKQSDMILEWQKAGYGALHNYAQISKENQALKARIEQLEEALDKANGK